VVYWSTVTFDAVIQVNDVDVRLIIFFRRVAVELEKEAKMSILHHINIVTLLAIIFEIGHYGIVMEYVLHGALNDFIFNYDVCNLFSVKQ